jgi:cytochrome c551/c552
MKTLIIILSPLAFALPAQAASPLFLTSDNCMACHNGLLSAKAEDVSIGFDWRSSVMAQSARDPYWQASVRRETIEHAPAAAAIEDECATCHMPMNHLETRAAGRKPQVFANLRPGLAPAQAASALDGVSCSLCHQIEADKLGKPESFVGNFVVDMTGRLPRKAFGPFDIKAPVARVMSSATQFLPAQAEHMRSAELCATCHTLITEALGPKGESIGRLPEQVPYQEWRESSYAQTTTCADCHMPKVKEPAPIANLLAEPRTGMSRHEFLGGNFLLPAMLEHLRVPNPALPQDFDRHRSAVRRLLAQESALLAIDAIEVKDGFLQTQITVDNQAGHKLPTAYPSRRAWLHIVVKDGAGKLVFESGALRSNGSIVGNDNDDDPARFEPHHPTIEKPDQVQIYEPILGDANGRVTTGLLHATQYLKDNRVLPSGFEKQNAPADVAVHGQALEDGDFVGGSDRLRVRIPVAQAAGPFSVQAELLYQPIGFRWAANLRPIPGTEPTRFNRAYDALAAISFQPLAHATATQTATRAP